MKEYNSLQHVEKQIRDGSCHKLRPEFLRDEWAKQCFGFSQALTVPMEIAQILKTPTLIKEKMVGEISEFIERLSISDYLEGINFDFEAGFRETRVQVNIRVAQPADGFKKQARQWYNYVFPEMDRAQRMAIVNVLIRAYVSRPFFETQASSTEWHSGTRLDFRSHSVSDSTNLRRDMDNLIQEGGRVSLQRLMITLRAKKPTGDFYKRNGELINYTLQPKRLR